MDYTPTLFFFVACGFLSAWLSFSIAYLMFKSWRMVRKNYLLGFPMGFTLLALTYAMLDIGYVFTLTNAWTWAQLLLGSWALVFLAVTYYLRYSSPRRTIQAPPTRSSQSSAYLTLATVAALFLLPPELLPPYLTTELLFRLVNLVLLGYVIYSLNRGVKTETGLSSIVLGFTFLTVDQCGLLLNTLDRTFLWPIIFAQLVRVVGLLILTIFLVRAFERRTNR